MTNAFTVTPMSNVLDLKPGDTYEGYILVACPDNSKEDFSYHVEVSPYSVIGKEYNADLTSISDSTAITNWVRISNPTGTIKPNESVRVNYTITVPEDVAGGGQYAALVVNKNASGANTESVGINNVFGIASVIYAKVDGEINHSGEVLENTVPGFTTSLPISANVMIKNDGNIHEAANIYLKIKNVFNGEVVYPKEGSSGGFEEEIMPGTTRYLQQSIRDISPLGIYEVTQTIDYLGQSNVVTQTMIVCPIWFMFLVFVTVCSIISYIISRVLKRKKTKE